MEFDWKRSEFHESMSRILSVVWIHDDGQEIYCQSLGEFGQIGCRHRYPVAFTAVIAMGIKVST